MAHHEEDESEETTSPSQTDLEGAEVLLDEAEDAPPPECGDEIGMPYGVWK